MNKKVGGFTLIELIIVMLLISILLSVAIPRFESGLLEDPTKKITRWMIMTTRFLRSQAIQHQKLEALVIDIDNSKLWVIDEGMDEQTQAASAQKAFKLPGGVRIVDVQFEQSDRMNSGTIEIHFYPAGYSDSSIIHFEDDDAHRFSIMVQPLLPKVKFFNEWLNF
jgi:prepilin-type N-terminal cleavage/methylation domain-containing protein